MRRIMIAAAMVALAAPREAPAQPVSSDLVDQLYALTEECRDLGRPRRSVGRSAPPAGEQALAMLGWMLRVDSPVCREIPARAAARIDILIGTPERPDVPLAVLELGWRSAADGLGRVYTPELAERYGRVLWLLSDAPPSWPEWTEARQREWLSRPEQIALLEAFLAGSATGRQRQARMLAELRLRRDLPGHDPRRAAELFARAGDLARQAEILAEGDRAMAEARARDSAAAEARAREQAAAEAQARERATAEAQARERAAAEIETRDRAAAEAQARGRAAAEARARERAVAEAQARDRTMAEAQARERAASEVQARERATAEAQARERAAAEAQARERAIAEAQTRERAAAAAQARERATAEAQARERAAAPPPPRIASATPPTAPTPTQPPARAAPPPSPPVQVAQPAAEPPQTDLERTDTLRTLFAASIGGGSESCAALAEQLGRVRPSGTASLTADDIDRLERALGRDVNGIALTSGGRPMRPVLTRGLVDANGRLALVQIVSSSGSTDTDQMVLAAWARLAGRLALSPRAGRAVWVTLPPSFPAQQDGVTERPVPRSTCL